MEGLVELHLAATVPDLRTVPPLSPKIELTNCIFEVLIYTPAMPDPAGSKTARITPPSPNAPAAKARARPTGRRRYDDGCAAAHALDLVGERWALLVVRELLLGPRRFSDLRQALGGISPNVLTQRLVDLEAAGVIEQRELPPPASCRVYALTPWGTELEPALMALLKWGVRSPDFVRGRSLTADAMALSFKAMFQPALASGLSCRVTLVMHRYPYHIAIEQGRIAVARGEPPCHPDQAAAWAGATLYAEPRTVLHLAYAKHPLAEALAAGHCRTEGDVEQLQRFLACFEVPPPVSPAPAGAGLL